jgi:hypothetical protein
MNSFIQSLRSSQLLELRRDCQNISGLLEQFARIGHDGEYWHGEHSPENAEPCFLKLTLKQKVLSEGKEPITAEFVFTSSAMGDIWMG